ncbi:hypothetical protein LC087_01760 [Bacillus carboniphilus]|uniref:Uncharacterized protein n=1 Tax=Bacillus carboniphilus TaxID=86663 RepID=A0ABY9JU89_9BACI|nr:hypothetical protein [Bacillus carboniphilus]WLR42971.1 hypothetical protein LC087_01760 [Bacillus carboniphilus]
MIQIEKEVLDRMKSELIFFKEKAAKSSHLEILFQDQQITIKKLKREINQLVKQITEFETQFDEEQYNEQRIEELLQDNEKKDKKITMLSKETQKKDEIISNLKEENEQIKNKLTLKETQQKVLESLSQEVEEESEVQAELPFHLETTEQENDEDDIEEMDFINDEQSPVDEDAWFYRNIQELNQSRHMQRQRGERKKNYRRNEQKRNRKVVRRPEIDFLSLEESNFNK